MSRNSLRSEATVLCWSWTKIGIWFLTRRETSLFCSASGVCLGSCGTMRTGVYFLRGRTLEFWRWPHTDAEIKNLYLLSLMSLWTFSSLYQLNVPSTQYWPIIIIISSSSSSGISSSISSSLFNFQVFCLLTFVTCVSMFSVSIFGHLALDPAYL